MANEIVKACRKGDLEKVKNLVEKQGVNKSPEGFWIRSLNLVEKTINESIYIA